MSEVRRVREQRWRTWMAAAQQGDGAAYEKLLHEALAELRPFVRRRVFDAAAQEDVVQNIFLSLHRARHTYRPERPFSPWLYAIARNAITDHTRSRMRRQSRERSLEDDGVAEPAVQAPELAAGELPEELRHALDSLPPKQREAVELVQVQGLSVAEAALQAGVSSGALKLRAHRGYKAMRALLARKEEAEA
jgi:RNA polymerase sigma-70 factor (ECF subfamily)